MAGYVNNNHKQQVGLMKYFFKFFVVLFFLEIHDVYLHRHQFMFPNLHNTPPPFFLKAQIH